MVNVADVAPPMFTPSFRHWKVGAGEPEAATVNETDPPQEACGEGCSVIAGTPIPTALATLLARAAPAGEF